ncbi:alport syndrome [Punctularia strigosozonata HHB-11173 SS5]|uniref:alport syndrome n=1 Tax=Punctularia strigosozonata (strain HHB-11173) TaxID=741275 RepID=UPI000441785F|nr:alport syndrome [Punctularia strigosozonata HHB-11173 SS5]EIN10388.1 alport syndrome [Punctularia strigosozonata HHB-11173 SS5]
MAPSGNNADGVCTPEHCFYAFDTLYCALTYAKPVAAQFKDDKYPLFVTWNTRSSRPGRSPRLRGCIGTFEALPLREGIAEYALISAFTDSRFRKITESELESLECGLSFLTDFEDAKSYLDWEVGTHGIRISFPHPSLIPSTTTSESPSPIGSPSPVALRERHQFSATYLPNVAPEQGWDRVETIDSAIRKAGWNGQITDDLRRNLKVRRYQSRKCTVGWDEYVEWRTAHGGKM